MKVIKVILALVIFSNMLILSACQNTVEGMGRDMQQTGKAIERAAN